MPKIDADLIKGKEAPATRSVLFWDTGHPDSIKGFGFRVFAPTKRHPSGARSFFISYRVAGFERRHTIGSFPTWTVTAARAEAKELRRRIDLGEDPAEAKREARDAPTVRDLIDRFIRDHLPTMASGAFEADGLTPSHRRRDVLKMLDEIGSLLGERRRVVDIHYGDIEHLHRKITNGDENIDPRPIRANRILAMCSTMFGLALKPLHGEAKPWRDQAQGNPCKGVPRNPEEGRERFFSTAELAAISEALAEYNGGKSSAAECLKFCMLTGCRPGEAKQAMWTEVDSEPGFWIKPSAHVKQRKSHKVPLNPAAIELIERLRKRRGSSPWMFPGSPASQPLRDITRCWDWVREHAELGPDAKPYTLRHSFASLGAGGGLSLFIIGKLMGHTQSKTTQRYAHLSDDPQREATTKIGNAITNAGKGGASVTSFNKSGAR
jgi:integrase